MPYTYKQFQDEPIYIATFGDSFDAGADPASVERRLSAALATHTGPVFYIADLTETSVSFKDVVLGLSNAYRSEDPSTYLDERLHMCIVGSDEFVRLAVDAVAHQRHYGEVKVEVFSTVEDALSHVRQQIGGAG